MSSVMAVFDFHGDSQELAARYGAAINKVVANSDWAGIASADAAAGRYYLVNAGREVVRKLLAAGLGDHGSDTGARSTRCGRCS